MPWYNDYKENLFSCYSWKQSKTKKWTCNERSLRLIAIRDCTFSVNLTLELMYRMERVK